VPLESPLGGGFSVSLSVTADDTPAVAMRGEAGLVAALREASARLLATTVRSRGDREGARGGGDRGR